jgi:tetratricopeptide (TPR) repeat protein
MNITEDIPIGIEDPEVETWRHLSLLTHKALQTSSPGVVNDALRDQINANPEGNFSPAFLSWIGENLKTEAKFENAIAVNRELSQRYGERPFDRGTWKELALEQVALCQERLGDAKAAIATYQAILGSNSKGLSEAWCYYQIGRLAERQKARQEAIEAYRAAAKASDEPPQAGISITDLARREADRLESPQDSIQAQPEQVVEALARALRRKDFASLQELASPTHFRLGVANSELSFVPVEKTLELLKQDFKESELVCDPSNLQGHGGKRYLATDGWRGQVFAGRVFFLICRTGDGWAWNGVVLTQPTKALSQVLESRPPMTNQPLSMPIKAPWPAGLSFRAGGVFNWVAEVLATGGPLSLFGWLIRLFLSDNDSGWGPAGFYYNQFTHSDSHAFAIDFTRYRRGAPMIDAANGVAVLNVAQGVVAQVLGEASDGDPINNNLVRIHHRALSEPWTFEQLATLTPTKFRSEYWHLSGPRRIPVFRGMWAPLGLRLGTIDDTGNSAFPHLHFVIQDRDLGFRSVRPTPMDGQTLNDGENYKRIRSSNVPF